jgi:hypothetical protein
MAADIPVACEVPMEQLIREAARRVAEGARRVLAQVSRRDG